MRWRMLALIPIALAASACASMGARPNLTPNFNPAATPKKIAVEPAVIYEDFSFGLFAANSEKIGLLRHIPGKLAHPDPELSRFFSESYAQFFSMFGFEIVSPDDPGALRLKISVVPKLVFPSPMAGSGQAVLQVYQDDRVVAYYGFVILRKAWGPGSGRPIWEDDHAKISLFLSGKHLAELLSGSAHPGAASPAADK